MSKQPRKKAFEPVYKTPHHSPHKILPLKQNFITFQSFYDYGNDYPVTSILVKNPKWCNLKLKLGHTGELKTYTRLNRAKSLRLRSLRLESYSLDSQSCGDQINPYFGELDSLIRAGRTLKTFSLSVIYDPEFCSKYGKKDSCSRLKKFVKDQRNLDEFGIYMGSRGDSRWMANLLKYVEKTVKVLTIENMAIKDLFKRFQFPKAEVLRFEYMLFYGSEMGFDFSILREAIKRILALPSLKKLVFSHYQRYEFDYYLETLLDEFEEEREDADKNINNVYEDNDKEKGDEEDQDRDEYEPLGSGVFLVKTKDPSKGGFDSMKEMMEKFQKRMRDARNAKLERRRTDPKIIEQKEKFLEEMTQSPEFWEELYQELCNYKEKELKIIYHKKDELDSESITTQSTKFQNLFWKLPINQNFEYQIAKFRKVDNDEKSNKKVDKKRKSSWKGIRICWPQIKWEEYEL